MNSLLDRATASFRLAVDDPSRGREEAESVAREAATSHGPEAAESEVVALRGAAWAARELFDHEAAQDLIERAVAIAEEQGLAYRHSECLLTRSTIYLEHGRQTEAKADLQTAISIAPSDIGAEAAVSLAVIDQISGAYVEALASYREALDLASPDQHDVRFKAFSNGAVCASRLGRHDEATTMIDEAVVVAEKSSAVYRAHAVHNRAVLAAERGDLTTALSNFDDALPLWHEAALRPTEHYLEKAETFLALRLLDEADAAVTNALDDLDGRPGAALLYSVGLTIAASIADARNQSDRAIELNERAAATFAAQDRPGWWALAEHAAVATRLAANRAPSPDDRDRIERVEAELARGGHTAGQVAAALTAGRVAHALGDRASAAGSYRRCAEMGRRGSALQRIQGWVAEAERAAMDGDSRRVSSAARAGLDTLDSYRSAFDAVELRARAASYGTDLAAAGLRLAAASGRPARVWSWLERTRAAALLDNPARADDQLTEVALGRLRAASAHIAELAPDDAAMTEAHRQLVTAEHEVRAASWQRSRAGNRAVDGDEPTLGHSPTAATLERIRADLGTTGLLQVGIVDDFAVAVAVTANRRAFARLGPTSEIDAGARQFAFALRRLGREGHTPASEATATITDAALDRLADLLTGPAILRALEHCDDLVVVPPSELVGIPWASLPSLADRPVSVSPSATAAWVTARRRPEPASNTVALAGPRLPNAGDEVERIAAVDAANTTAYTGQEATSTALSTHAARASTVHIAAHGHIRRDSPTFSAFELADGPFTVHDIERLPAPIPRWILAACDLGTAGSDGSDLEGVVAALVSAGAGSVVAAVGPMPDDSTTALMVELHAQLKTGVTASHALHVARHKSDPSNAGEWATQLAFACFGSA